jgi:hypothetical protein
MMQKIASRKNKLTKEFRATFHLHLTKGRANATTFHFVFLPNGHQYKFLARGAQGVAQ